MDESLGSETLEQLMGVDSQPLDDDWEGDDSKTVDPTTLDTLPAEFPEDFVGEDPTPVLSELDARILELQHFGCIKSK